MVKPSLAGFQIATSDVDEAKRIDLKLVWATVVISAASIGTGIAVGDKARALSVLLVLIGCPLPPIGPLIVYHATKAIIRRIRPAYDRVMRFQVALQEYDAWWTRTQAEFWRGLSGLAFEIELANLYRRLGHQADVTSPTNDKGVDIWLVRSGHRIPVQCKAHRRPIGPGVVRELCGTMQQFGATEGILASVSGFTSGARSCATGKGIALLDLAVILEMQRSVGDHS